MAMACMVAVPIYGLQQKPGWDILPILLKKLKNQSLFLSSLLEDTDPVVVEDVLLTGKADMVSYSDDNLYVDMYQQDRVLVFNKTVYQMIYGRETGHM